MADIKNVADFLMSSSSGGGTPTSCSDSKANDASKRNI